MKRIGFIEVAILVWLLVTPGRAFAYEAQTIWDATYNGALNLDDYPYRMAVDSNGDVVVAGSSIDFTNSWGSSSPSACVIKYSGADGHIIWKTTLVTSSNIDYPNYVGSVIIDKNNDIYVGGQMGGDTTFIIKLSGLNGLQLWVQFGQHWPETGMPNLALDQEGNVISAATSLVVVSGDWESRYQMEVMKCNSANGKIIWDVYFNPVSYSATRGDIRPRAMVVDQGNNIYITGNEYDYTAPRNWADHSYTMKVSGANGLQIWRMLGPLNAQALDMVLDSTGSIIIAEFLRVGENIPWDATYTTTNTLRKLRAGDGSTIWENILTDIASSGVAELDLGIDSADNLFACGSFARGEWIAKYSGGTGDILWQKANSAPSLPGFDSQNGYAKRAVFSCLAVDDFDDVHAAGCDIYQYHLWDMHSAKYDGISGEIIYETTAPGVSNYNANLTLTDSGTNTLTIKPLLTGNGYDWCTTKLATLSTVVNLDGPTIPDGWEIAGVADFNSDTHPDLLLVNSSTRATQFHYLNVNQETSVVNGPALPLNTRVGGIADFNGDKKPDVAVYNTINRKTTIGYLNNNVLTSSAPGPTLDVGTVLRAAIDCDQDKKPDFVTLNPQTGATTIKHLDNNRLLSQVNGPTLKTGMQIATVGTLNADKTPDYVLDDANYGLPATWHLNKKSKFISNAYGASLPAGWKVSAAADFDNDGRSDYLLYNPTTRATRVWPLK